MTNGIEMREQVLRRIYEVTPTQKKKIDLFFSRTPQAADDLASFLQLYSPFLKAKNVSAGTLADSYLEMVDQMMHSRLYFLRTGKYPSNDQTTALVTIYSNETLMTQYMFGIALSLFLWKDHYLMLQFYLDAIKKQQPEGPCLEVGCGHGYFLLEMLRRTAPNCLADAVDISATSLAFTKGILSSVDSALMSRVEFYHADLASFRTDRRYKFITMGEVLEHVDDPLGMLQVLKDLCDSEGRIYITTCANCPAIDHVYHFESVQSIRDLIAEAGLRVESELVTPSEEKSQEELERLKIDIAYAAILVKA
jgi:2-polyprenyl-3-methyl-5-hydroxy-6-metoxy-1,4-benzoquinol methylase